MIPSSIRTLSKSCLLAAILALPLHASQAADNPAAVAAIASSDQRINPWKPRLGRTHPIVAVIGENSGTELVDFVVPYGVVADSGVADVVALSTGPGPLQFRPALSVQTQETLTSFDEGTPLGADYVIVPAFTEDKVNDPAVLAWLRAQSDKGATVVSICDGALVVANAGLFEGHRATGHWATDGRRRSEHPGAQWVDDARYVADGNVVSSAGVSAAIPVSLALVEAMGGKDAADRTAARLGATDWSDEHDSHQFRIGVETVLTYVGNRYLHGNKHLVIPVSDGVDDIALALTLDAYGRTMRSPTSIQVGTAAGVRSSHGLWLLPAKPSAAHADDALLLWQGPAFAALDHALADIRQRYGASSARYVALGMEYAPGYSDR
jgi:transcriptional regulator GlxA family with amidase domain